MSKRVTMADVAREAGVSLQTVSRAINNKGEISPATKAKVLEVVERLGFRPSSIARSLATRRTATVGLVVADITNPFFSEITRGVEDVAYANDYNVLLCNTDEDIQREQAVLDSLLDKQVDGLILTSSRLDHDDLLERLQQFSSVVLINRDLDLELERVRTLIVEDESASAQAVEHLLSMGHQHIAFLGGPERSESGKKRFSGYRRALQSYGIHLDPALIAHSKPDMRSGQQAAERILRAHPEVSAIFAFNDLIAIGAMLACQSLGYSVPEQVAVIGCDDIPLAAVMVPRLSTLHVPIRELGVSAMKSLIQLMDRSHSRSARVPRGPNPPQRFEAQLVLRESAPASLPQQRVEM